MSRLIVTETAAKGLEHCRVFLSTKNPNAMKRAALAIDHQLILLEQEPKIGRPLDEFPDLRELVIPFGDSGFVALNRYEVIDDAVYVLAFRHQKEAGY